MGWETGVSYLLIYLFLPLQIIKFLNMFMTKITFAVKNDKIAHILVLLQHGHKIPVCTLLLLQVLHCAPLYQGWHTFEKDVLVCAEDGAFQKAQSPTPT